MACPFVRHEAALTRQPSVADQTQWGMEDDLAEIPDALTLTHLQVAIQLLTAPSVCFIRHIYAKPHPIACNRVFVVRARHCVRTQLMNETYFSSKQLVDFMAETHANTKTFKWLFSFLLSFYCAQFHLQNEDVNTAVSSLIGKYKGRWPALSQL